MALSKSAHFEAVTSMLAYRLGKISFEENFDHLARIADEIDGNGEVIRLIAGLADLASGGAIIAGKAAGITPEEVVQQAATWFASTEE